MNKPDPAWYCHECDTAFRPVVMFPKPLCASCYSPHVRLLEPSDSTRASQRTRTERKAPYSRPPLKTDLTSDPNMFGTFVRRFAHQPRNGGLVRTASGASIMLDTVINPSSTSSQTDRFSSETCEKPANVPSSSTTPAISRSMPICDVLDILVQHGCQDITQEIDLSTCSRYPVANGGFGDIYKGKLIDGDQVAIKCTRIIIDSVTDKEQHQLACAARELHTWSKLNHRYILKLLGLAQHRGQIAMISPWVERGPLSKYLENHPQLNRPQFCAKIADGLSFLHSNQVVHGDLKAANILVSCTEEPLIADFGNAIVHERTLQFTQSATRSNLSPRWTAPEILAEGPCTAEADVYALGMTILEVITGAVPYPNMKDLAVIVAVTQNRLPDRPEEHIPSASTEGDTLWQLLVSCWAFEPQARLTAAAVKDVLANVTPEGLVYYRLLAPSSPVDERYS